MQRQASEVCQLWRFCEDYQSDKFYRKHGEIDIMFIRQTCNLDVFTKIHSVLKLHSELYYSDVLFIIIIITHSNKVPLSSQDGENLTL